MVMVPGELPGANMPPLMIVVAPTVPVPASSAPAFTVTAELAIEPFTTSVPALTVVGPLYVLAAVRLVVPVPFYWNAPLPEMTFSKVNELERLMAKILLLTTLPASAPLALPLPSCSVPALMVVGPA
jgi:hypothetical protein